MKYKGIVIVTGVGVRPVKKVFKNSDVTDLVEYKNKKFKINAASGAAIQLNRDGYLVFMTSSSAESLKVLGSLLKGKFYEKKMELHDNASVNELASRTSKISKEKNIDVHLVYYGSLSDTKVKLPHDSIFLHSWETPPHALSEIVSVNITPFLALLHALRPIFKHQKKTKVVVITAIAALRPLPVALLDNVQKGAVHAMARSLALDLTKENIYITEIMPGTTDTGFYDNEFTLEGSILHAKEFGYHRDEETLPMLSGQKIGRAVAFALEADAHIREISLIPYGQYPHLGA